MKQQSSLIGAARELLSAWSRDIGEDEVGAAAPLTPPNTHTINFIIDPGTSQDDTPVSRFRRDVTKSEKEALFSSNDDNVLSDPDQSENCGEVMVMLHPKLDRLSADCERNGNSSLVMKRENDAVDQARDAISAVTSDFRLTDDRIQEILMAAMRYEKDHAPTVTSRPPSASESAETKFLPNSHNQLVNSVPSLLSEDEQEQKSLPENLTDNDDYDAINLYSDHVIGPQNMANGGSQSSRIRDQKQDEPSFANDSSVDRSTPLESEQKLESPKPDFYYFNNVPKLTIQREGGALEDVGPVRLLQKDDGSVLVLSLNGDEQITADETEENNTAPLTSANLLLPQHRHASLHPALQQHIPGQIEVKMMRSQSFTESEFGSTDGLPFRIHSTVLCHGRNVALQMLDGVEYINVKAESASTSSSLVDGPEGFGNNFFPEEGPSHLMPCLVRVSPFLESFGLSPLFWCTNTTNVMDSTDDIAAKFNCEGDRAQSSQRYVKTNKKDHFLNCWDEKAAESIDRLSPWSCAGPYPAQPTPVVTHAQQRVDTPPKQESNGYWGKKADEALDLLGHCSAIVSDRTEPPQISKSLASRLNEAFPTYGDAVRADDIDSRLQSWISSHYEIKEPLPAAGAYELGKSRTVIVHEIARGDWTWCTAWSPKGDRLAVATENHHLAVIETTASTVWRVLHDRRLKGPAIGDTTHSIRSLAWGKKFIAAGGTGNAVSILSPIEPYAILHVVKGTGFVGSLSWRVNSNLLAIASRANKFLITRVRSTEGEKIVDSEILYTAQFQNWVNCVAFSPTGTYLAAGNASGTLSVYSLEDVQEEVELDISLLHEFQLDDSILALDWSPDGRWLYAGGEDSHITVIETTYWEIIHKINRERWVQCIASSRSSTHVAVGGVSSEISILDVRNGWDSVMGIELKGLVPLSASWHPDDQALALTGQNDSILVVETNNARHIRGHHLRSISPIVAVAFSPDGRTAIIGNEAGVVTFFSLSGSTFETAYELFVSLNERISIDWSPDGLFALIGSKDVLIMVRPNSKDPNKKSNRPKNQCRPLTSFSVQQVIRGMGETNCVSIDCRSQYVAAGGDRTRVFDATKDYREVKSWMTGVTYSTAWSPDGTWLATIGLGKTLYIYDTRDNDLSRWRSMFSLRCDFVGYALAWGPCTVGGLVYLAYGGANKTIYIMEIRTLEGTWETVLRISRSGEIRALDWGIDGLLAAGISDGTVSIVDLSYLQSGVAVNEKDYTWQRQALTCFTEIRRNRGKNCIQAVKWIPSLPGSDNLLALGGTDGEVEIVDLTPRRRCRGYAKRQCVRETVTTVNH